MSRRRPGEAESLTHQWQRFSSTSASRCGNPSSDDPGKNQPHGSKEPTTGFLSMIVSRAFDGPGEGVQSKGACCFKFGCRAQPRILGRMSF
jgi:hypothetical protein